MQMEARGEQIVREAADYVDQNGIEIYRYAAVMDKETVLALLDQPDVYVVYTEPLPSECKYFSCISHGEQIIVRVKSNRQ